jgi:DNA-binding response OmpR family regulator
MKSLRVLIIDDSPLALEVQVMMLERRGYTVCGCLDLVAMREAANDFVPDVIVTDVNLADATVEEACAAVRASFGDDVPLLLFSGQEDHTLALLVERLGVDGFINKAAERRVVYDKIEAVARVANT